MAPRICPAHQAILISIGLAVGLFGLGSSHDSVQAGSYYPADYSKPKDFTIVKSGDVWHLISIHATYGVPGPGQPASPGLVHSTSRDLILWQDVGVAIPVGPWGTWDSYDVWAPTTVKVGDTYHLWYAGVQLVGSQYVQKIGHATSTDLTTWTKDPANPVFDCSTLSWAYWNMSDLSGLGTNCRDPFVTWDAANNQWVMLYTAQSQHIDQDPLKYITYPAIIGMATSTDLVTWNDAGPIITTGGYTAESPHVIEHNGTWWLIWTNNCSWRGSKCLKYATAPALTGPYTGYTDLPAVNSDGFASEYFQDSDGTELFGREGSAGGWLDFSRLTWLNGVFTLSPTPSGSVSGRVWKDDNGNGRIDPGENGSNGLTVSVYLDNGDGVFDPLSDRYYTYFSTFNGGTRLNPLNGTFRFPFVTGWIELPWTTMWIQVDPDSLELGTPSLAGQSPTTPAVIKFVNPSDAVLTNANFGYNGNDALPPAAVGDLLAQ